MVILRYVKKGVRDSKQVISGLRRDDNGYLRYTN